MFLKIFPEFLRSFFIIFTEFVQNIFVKSSGIPEKLIPNFLNNFSKILEN